MKVFYTLVLTLATVFNSIELSWQSDHGGASSSGAASSSSRSRSPSPIRSRSRSPNGTQIPPIFQKGKFVTPTYFFPALRVIVEDADSRTGFVNIPDNIGYRTLATRNGEVFGIYGPRTGLFRRFFSYDSGKQASINMALRNMGVWLVHELTVDEKAYLNRITPRILRLPTDTHGRFDLSQ